MRCGILVLLAYSFFTGLTSISESSENPYHWWVANSEMNEKHTSLLIAKAGQNIELRGGWSCHISNSSINNARQTSCTKGDEQVEFSVMCDRNRPKDHGQIRFRSPGTNELIDFIEVGCEPSVPHPVGDAKTEHRTKLLCKSNAKTVREYGFREQRWEGHTDLTRDSKVAGVYYALRDWTFSDLETPEPIVHVRTRFVKRRDKVEELEGKIVGRSHVNDAIFVSWTNDMNKVSIASLDLKRRKAVLVKVFDGITSLGGEVETLDCR